ncbi:hypothetical protein OSK38_27880, partial [Escherichia coli]|nr:hypothetical protein [Escherichia coli]
FEMRIRIARPGFYVNIILFIVGSFLAGYFAVINGVSVPLSFDAKFGFIMGALCLFACDAIRSLFEEK